MGQIAFIAPYEEIFEIGKRVVAELRLSGQIDCYLGWLQEGVGIARKLEAEGVDVIISRGGTAELIAKADIQVPIVEIPISFQDLAEALMEAKKLTNRDNPKIAILAFKNMIRDIDVLAKLMDARFMIYQLDSEDGIESTVKQALHENPDIIIGGIKTTNLAAEMGMKTLLLTSGEDSYRAAVLEAKKVSYARTLEKQRMRKFRVLVDYSNQGIIGVESDGTVSVFNNSAERLLGLNSRQATGRRIESIIPGLPVGVCMEEAEEKRGELIRLNDKRLIANIVPIDVGGSVSGAMITIEDVGRIMEMEANIRNEMYSKGLYAQYHFSDIFGRSPQIEEVKRIAKAYAETDATVIILGASGTGKELFAQSIHNASRRARRPFVAINCGAIPASLIESELFGYVEGAFTGAMRKGKPGLFELAHRGTIFLDEISEMNKLAQTSLLRVIQERRVMRVGGSRYLPIDVRIIAATNKDLEKMVLGGLLREDLYYRINVLPLEIPPLCDRTGDALLIAEIFLQQYNRIFGKHLKFSDKTKEFIQYSNWPGNVRQLRNYVERLVVVTRGSVINVEGAAPMIRHPKLEISSETALVEESSERAKIMNALIRSNFNRKEAAKILGIDRSTLYRRMRASKVEIKEICR